MHRVLLAAATVMIGMPVTCEAGSFDEAYAAQPHYRHFARGAHAKHWRVKPYYMGVGGLIVVREPYGAWIHEHAVRTRDPIIWGR
jgi:hypothetical protein